MEAMQGQEDFHPHGAFLGHAVPVGHLLGITRCATVKDPSPLHLT